MPTKATAISKRKIKALIVSADWKGRTNCKDVSNALKKLGIKVFLKLIDTDSDEEAVIFSKTELTSIEAKKIYYQ